MENLLSPEKYIGRCPEQVDAFLQKIKPLLADMTRDGVEIDL